jgi:putative glutamine amidotransferase
VAGVGRGDARRDGPAPAPHPSRRPQAGSLLASHLGDRYEVDSYHHRAVKELGTGLKAVAWEPHGTIEAVEMPGSAAFVLGVQWELHEEWEGDDRMLGIWRAFAADARRRMEARVDVGVP